MINLNFRNSSSRFKGDKEENSHIIFTRGILADSTKLGSLPIKRGWFVSEEQVAVLF